MGTILSDICTYSVCLIRKIALKPYISCGIPSMYNERVSKTEMQMRSKYFTQIYDFNEFKEIIFDA